MKYSTFAYALVFLASTLTSEHSFAATRTATVTVSATVVSSCQVSALSTPLPGNMATRANGASSVSVNCTNPTAYNVTYNTGTAPNVTTTARRAAVPEGVNEASNGNISFKAAYRLPAKALDEATGADADCVTVTIIY